MRGMGTVSRFELDPGARTSSDGRVLFGGSPLSLFRLTPAGSKIVDRIRTGEHLAPGHGALTTRLVSAGALHPVPDPGTGPTTDQVTLVVPAFAADPERVQALSLATGCSRTIVVDDASIVPFPPLTGIEVIRFESNAGPGAARQAGLERVSTPFVVFLDTDITVEDGWITALLPFFADDKVALVAPRVRASERAGVSTTALSHMLSQFESLRGPLDLGPHRGRIRAASRVSYVPAAALVARTDALRAIGGFDPALRLGEDVDLVWRLDEAGWMCRYEPGVEVRHDVRTTLRAWLRQRVGYGFSATDLALRHPGAVAPIQTSIWSAASWALSALGLPVVGAAVAAGSTAALVKKLPEMADREREALRLAGLGHLHAGRILATALTRSWWPVSLLAALVSSRARRVLVAAVAVPTLLDWWKVRRSIDPVRFAVLRLLDDGSYGFGLWKGAWTRQSAAALVPDLTSWPNRPKYAASREAAGATAAGGPQK